MSSGVVEAALLAEHINDYYLDAFNHALVVVGIVFGVVGIVVPAGIAYFQSRQSRYELEQVKRNISDEVSSRVDAEKQRLLQEQAAALVAFSERSDKVIADLKQETKVELGLVRAGTFHVQALMYQRSRTYGNAFRSAIDAGHGYVAGEDFHHLRRVVEGIAIKSLQKLNKADLESATVDVEKFRKLLKKMETCNHKGAFVDLISKGKKELERALAREPEGDE